MTVYAVNYSALNYSNAEQFGEVVYMTKGVLDLDKLDYYDSIISKYLQDSVEEDMLLFSGSNLVCGIALKNWLKLHPTCTVLYWEKKKREYCKKVIKR